VSPVDMKGTKHAVGWDYLHSARVWEMIVERNGRVLGAESWVLEMSSEFGIEKVVPAGGVLALELS
jgi:hypothetical protein